ncbi:MAG: Clp protease, partial [Hyphomicrobium sp.]
GQNQGGFAQQPLSPGQFPPQFPASQPMARPPGPPQSAPWAEHGGPPAPRGPHYDDAMARLDARRPQQPPGSAQPTAPAPHRRPPNTTTVQAGQLVENIPRKMRAFIPVIVEARIARAEVKAIADGLQGDGAVFRHEVTVTKAMSVRLRAPDGGFYIETASPETQWIENVLGLMSNDYASWRWSVTPQERGKRKLQLVISARTVGTDGLTAETALPDQIIDVAIGINVTRTLIKWGTWLGAAVAGGLLSHFGDTIFEFGKALIAGAT